MAFFCADKNFSREKSDMGNFTDKATLRKLASIVFLCLIGIALKNFFPSKVLYCYLVCVVICLAYQYTEPDKKIDVPRPSIGKREIFVILFSAIFAVTLCSKSSPLYPFNDWGDANCYFTVGKSMLHGLVPYRDSFDHKGPLLHMLHAVAAMISRRTFFGVYLLELVAATFFCFLSFKFMRLLRPNISVIYVPILASAVYSARIFYHGDSAEELCLPLLVYALYVGIKSVRNEQPPTKSECFLIGATSACVLWIKFTMLGFYIGWIFVPAFLLIRERKFGELFRLILWIGCGVVVVTLPILLYFMMNHALMDLFTVYFYNNMFLYANFESDAGNVLLKNLAHGFRSVIKNSPIVPAIPFGALMFLRNRKYAECIFFLSCAVAAFLPIYIGGQTHGYYSLAFSSFIPVGLAAVDQALHKKLIQRKNPTSGALPVVVASFLFAVFSCSNIYLLAYDRADMPQYKFAEIIEQKPDATLLNYGFLDGGFYTTTGIVPNCKYFCELNMQLEAMILGQAEVVKNGGVDFVVTEGVELKSEFYDRVADATIFYEGRDRTYYLHRLNKNGGAE